MGEMDDGIIKEFLVESFENLDQLDRDLVALEQEPGSKATLASVFRTIHTIKGTCGFLGLSRLESVAHSGESLLSRLRDGELSLTPEITTVLLAMVDAVRQMLASIEKTRTEGTRDYSDLIGMIKRVAESGAGAAAASVPATTPAPSTPAATTPAASTPAASTSAASAAATSTPAPSTPAATTPATSTPAASAAAPKPPAPGTGAYSPEQARTGGMFESLIRSGRLDREQVELAARLQQAGDPRRLGEILVDMGVLHPDDVLQALKSHPSQSTTGAVQSSIRVDVELLERLMNRVGELVLARNQMLQLTATQDLAALPATAQRLNLITSDLQEAIMKTRMQPIRLLLNRLPRMVRDLAASLHKQVRLEIEGAETELDRSMIEAIKDPLTHLVRNAVDHGIEEAAVRAAQSKPAEGRLVLRAYHEGGQVNIEVSDDGAGIAVDRIRMRALERGLVSIEQAERMKDAEWMHLIFLPGFSTSETVSNVSGRGVGMDVVKSNLDRIGGTVEVQSRPGAGTLMKIKIPLTLAIIPALCVTAGGEDYAIPQANLIELVRLQGEAALRGVERIQEAAVYRLRGKLLPLVFLDDWLGVEAGARRAAADALSIAVVQSDGRPFGLVVDTVGDSREIIVKPLGRPLSQIASYAGATILGDGRVALILDVQGIAREAGIVVQTGHAILSGSLEEAPDEGESARERRRRQPLLVFEAREDWRAAAPLRAVTRIEEFEAAAIEQVGDRQVVQYRGTILPLVRLEHLLDPATPAWRPVARWVSVLVYPHQAGHVGLVVERVVDIEEHDGSLLERSAESGIVASFVIGKRVTDVLDLDALLARADPGRLIRPVPESSGAGA